MTITSVFMVGFSSSIGTISMAIIQLLEQLNFEWIKILLDTYIKPSIHSFLQIPATTISVILTDKSGRRPLLMVRTAQNQL
jgi:hypothetical protein